jgi:hypothetical protein
MLGSVTTSRTDSRHSASDAAATDWLLASDEPGVRMQARRDLLGQDATDDAAHVLEGRLVKALFSGQRPDGGFSANWYSKWHGAHWRLVALVELGIPADEPRAVAAYETILKPLLGRAHLDNVPQISGRYRRCASQEGNALGVGVRLGRSSDPRVGALAENLVRWQWPDGGWNCDRKPAASHASFYESITPLWGLAEFARATGEPDVVRAAQRAAELFLRHQVYRSHRTGHVADRRWTGLHWPPYYGYTALWGLVVLARAGALPDPRADDAVGLIRGRQGQGGRWPVDGPWGWRSPGMRRAERDPAPWPQSGPSEMITLNALRALRAAEGLGGFCE